MIKMKKYDASVEKKFLNAVEDIVDIDDRAKIVESFRKYFPKGVIPEHEDVLVDFAKLILADYNTLQSLYTGMDKTVMKSESHISKKRFTDIYKMYHDSYDSLTQHKIGKEKVNVYLVRNSNMYVCPYCNRSYINVRGDEAAGAQLDHFINRSEYPIFALCLYNLIPVCGTCNLLKSAKEGFISPFDPALKDEFVKFKQKGELLTGDLAVEIKAEPEMEKNVKELRLREAYEIHKEDLKDLLEQVEAYPESQRTEICDVINKTRKPGEAKFTEEDIRNRIFGRPVLYEEYGRKPLAKFRHDILKEKKIY